MIAAGAVLGAVTLALVAAPAQASSVPRTRAEALTIPRFDHRYRHGAIPRPTRLSEVPAALQPDVLEAHAVQNGSPIKRPLRYGGGPVVTGSPKVYLVFWGSNWGAESTNGSGYKTFAGDPAGVAPELQAFYSGLGTGVELWSAVATQYCQGLLVGATSCPASGTHVGYPGQHVLAGVWEDTSFTQTTGTGPSTSSATAVQIAEEAAAAATRFGDSSQSAEFVIVSPTGTNPDGWLNPTTGYCGYHDDTADQQVGGPDVAYTNLPYIPDIPATSCSSFTSPGPLDGLTEVAGHEYAETLTDPFGGTGWADAHGNELADKCAYLTPGQPGAAIYLPLATGSFDVQGLWANDSGRKGGCETSHSPVLVSGPGKRYVSTQGVPATLQIGAFDVLGRTITFSANGLPAGLTIDPASGVISGTATARHGSKVTVNAADGVGSASVTFKWVLPRAGRRTTR